MTHSYALLLQCPLVAVVAMTGASQVTQSARFGSVVVCLSQDNLYRTRCFLSLMTVPQPYLRADYCYRDNKILVIVRNMDLLRRGPNTAPPRSLVSYMTSV